MNNKAEVGITADDNNDRRLPGSIQPEPTIGATPSNFAKQTPLDSADTGGVVGRPTFDDSGMSQEGYLRPHQNANVNVKGPTGEVETTYDHANLSAKYKYPNVKQDIPPLGRPSTTYSDHT